MKNITKILAILLIFNILFACKTSQNNNDDSDVVELIGNWKENWTENNQLLSYNDVYSMKVTDNILYIRCVSKKYKIENISYKKRVLRFLLTNTDKYEKEAYRINYELTFKPETRTLEGTAKTDKGVTAKILWFTE